MISIFDSIYDQEVVEVNEELTNYYEWQNYTLNLTDLIN